MAGKKPRYFYGWNIVAASLLANLAYAEHQSSVLGLFFKPLQAEFGWSRTAIAFTQTIARLVEAGIAPFVGPLIDRYGPRVLMPIGAFIVGLAMLGITQVDALWQFYLIRGAVVAVGFTLMGMMVSNVAVSNWFVRKRGRALGIAHMGQNISNVVFVSITVFIIAASGWRTMFIVFAVVAWLFALVPSVIIMRRRPEDMGLHPDGEAPLPSRENESAQVNGETSAAGQPEPVWTRREALYCGSFWMVAICFGIAHLAFQGINISLAAFIQDLGYSDATVAGVMAFRAVIMIVAVTIMGFIAEHAHRAFARVLPFLIQSSGVFCMLFADFQLMLWLGVALYAVGFSGIIVTQEVIYANYFGRLSLGTVRSLGFFITLGLGAAGPVAMNAIFDIFGSYRFALIAIIFLFLSAALLLALTRPPEAKNYATAAEWAARENKR
ncbi:MFS transporter [Chloroflexota bacterium]